jgi:isoleucyl-tRNA synthetase
VAKLDAEKAAEKLIAGETIEVGVEGENLTLLPDEVEVRVEAHEGFAAVAEGAYVAALDTELNEKLKREGLAREFVRRVQEQRKKADFKVDDRIRVQYKASERLEQAIASHEDYIRGETIADSLASVDEPEGEQQAEDTFDGEELVFAVERVEA